MLVSVMEALNKLPFALSLSKGERQAPEISRLRIVRGSTGSPRTDLFIVSLKLQAGPGGAWRLGGGHGHRLGIHLCNAGRGGRRQAQSKPAQARRRVRGCVERARRS